ncbi:hypothetical protein BH20ACI4_BH20ACI4_09800 [soil metagenome]
MQLIRNFQKHFFCLLVFSILIFGTLSVHAQEDGEDDSGKAVALFNQGQDAHEKGNLASALKFYDEALKIIPEFPEAEYQRGMAFLALKKYDEAEKAFRRALELREDWTLPMAQLGSLLVTKNQFTEAEPLLIKAAEADDQNFLAFSALTELRLKTNAAPEVLRELLGKVQLLTSKANPTSSVWAARAALESKLGDKKSAKQSLTRALAIEPENNFALNERINIALSESDFRSALADAKTLVKINSGSVNSNLILVRVYFASGNLPEADKLLDLLDQTNASVIEFKKNLTSNNPDSVKELEKILAENPKNAGVLAKLCVLKRVDDPPKSLEYCRSASELEPENINHAIGYGAALVQAKNYEQAVGLFRRILEVAPDNYTAHANLAAALFQLKRYNEAIVEYNWISQKQPDLAIANYFLGISYDSLGEYLDAMANYQQFLRIAKPEANQLEIEKVNLRIPSLQRLIEMNKNKKRRKQ